MSDIYEPQIDESEQLDQLQSDDSLVDRGVDDVLDEGYIAPDHWSPGMGFGNTPAEMREGETIEQRLTQEQPVVVTEERPWRTDPSEPREVGGKRAGRLIKDGDTGAVDAGIDGGAASAEEAAMHVIDLDDDEA